MNTIKQARKLAEKTFSDLTVSDYTTQKAVVVSVRNCLELDNLDVVLNVLETSLNATGSELSDFVRWELEDLINTLSDKLGSEVDFYLDELPCGEARIICEDEIDQIWTDSLIEQVKECYDLSNVPRFVAIDWEQTAENCKVDGKGHHFSSYDGEEHFSKGFFIFRTN